MEEDTEVLDWGNEDDEQQQQQHSDLHRSQKGGSGDVEDAEDAVSLDGDDDDQAFIAYQRQDPSSAKPISIQKSDSANHQPQQQAQQYQQHSTPQAQNRDVQRENSSNSQKYFSGAGSPPNTSNSPQRSQSFSKIIHSLPPKPVVANVPFMHPSHPSIIEATAMSRSTVRISDRDKSKANGGLAGKPVSSSNADPSLPPDWEIKHPRNGGGVYYYNTKTQKSTWTRPVSSTQENGGRRGRSTSRTSAEARPSHSAIATSRPPRPFDPTNSSASQVMATSASADALSYEDRHYRPGGGDAKVPADSSSNKRELDSRYAPQNSYTPPASPGPEHSFSRSRSPPPQHLQRGRDQARPPPSYPSSRSGPNIRAQGQGRDSSRRDSPPRRASSVPRDSPGRHWVPPVEPQSPTHSRRQPRQVDTYPEDASIVAYDGDRNPSRNGRGGHSQSRDHNMHDASAATLAPSTLSSSSLSFPPLLPPPLPVLSVFVSVSGSSSASAITPKTENCRSCLLPAWQRCVVFVTPYHHIYFTFSLSSPRLSSSHRLKDAHHGSLCFFFLPFPLPF